MQLCSSTRIERNRMLQVRAISVICSCICLIKNVFLKQDQMIISISIKTNLTKSFLICCTMQNSIIGKIFADAILYNLELVITLRSTICEPRPEGEASKN